MIASGMEQLFRVDGSPKRKILPLAYRMVRQSTIRPRQLLHDVYQVARAYLW
jgi:electron transfer flavoprotein-quinone oxidoreductase